MIIVIISGLPCTTVVHRSTYSHQPPEYPALSSEPSDDSLMLIVGWCWLWAVECKKTIEVASARDHNQELYCKTCHGRLFGPKGYGFAGGAGTMLSMDTGKCGSIPAKYGICSYLSYHLLFMLGKT